MKLEFKANGVCYEEALGGDLVHVSFEENPDDDSLKPTSKSLFLSINYEFPPCRIYFEWCDGNEFDGRFEAKRYNLSHSEFYVELTNGSVFNVEFKTDELTYQKIEQLLRRELGN